MGRRWCAARAIFTGIRLVLQFRLRSQKHQLSSKPGRAGSWDESGVADPYVIERNGELYMYYLGMDRARRQRLGVARSHDGVVWEKLISNPIMELGASGAFDEMGLGEPAVWSSGGSYWMLYTGRARGEKRRIGLAKSPDGISWVAPAFGDRGDQRLGSGSGVRSDGRSAARSGSASGSVEAMLRVRIRAYTAKSASECFVNMP